jgi:phytanoyl-CoA dioxygenase PhyH
MRERKNCALACRGKPRKARRMPTSLTPADAENVAFWRALQPNLSIEGSRTTEAFQLGDVGALMEQLRFEGYVNVPGVLPEALVVAMRNCIAMLHERRIPLAFTFVYDEAWQVFQGLTPFIEAALGMGYRALPDFWVWHVLPSESATGWGPHRDKVQPTVDRNNAPHSMTVWVPFTDATPLNGCIYMLPAHLDPRFKRRDWGGEGNNLVDAPQNMRALPATAGSMLAWNQAVLHWGGRASRLAQGPRSSAALEFQRGDKAPFNRPLLDPKRVPSFQQRLGLVGKQVLQYQHMYPLAPDIAAIAETLRARFMPGGALGV